MRIWKWIKQLVKGEVKNIRQTRPSEAMNHRAIVPQVTLGLLPMVLKS